MRCQSKTHVFHRGRCAIATRARKFPGDSPVVESRFSPRRSRRTRVTGQRPRAVLKCARERTIGFVKKAFSPMRMRERGWPALQRRVLLHACAKGTCRPLLTRPRHASWIKACPGHNRQRHFFCPGGDLLFPAHARKRPRQTPDRLEKRIYRFETTMTKRDGRRL